MAMCDLATISRVDWDWFVSCTLAERNASDHTLFKVSFACYRYIAKIQRVPLQALLIAQRIHSGVDPAHRHFHFLIGGLRRVGTPERMKLIAFYNRLVGSVENSLGKIPRGTIRVRLYDAKLGAVAYLLRNLNSSEAAGWLQSEVWLSKAVTVACRGSEKRTFREARSCAVTGKSS